MNMAVGHQNNLQSAFLNHVRQHKVPLMLYLANGIKLQGIVTWFDNFSVQLTRDGQSQLIMKSAISTITSNYPIKLRDDSKKGD
jgi:RNA chaperone Hfq